MKEYKKEKCEVNRLKITTERMERKRGKEKVQRKTKKVRLGRRNEEQNGDGKVKEINKE